MDTVIGKWPVRNGIIVHHDERAQDWPIPERAGTTAPTHAETDLAALPCASSSQHPSLRSATPRLVQDAQDWSICRARRMRLEEQLALQEEFRIVDAELASAIRQGLQLIECRFGDLPMERMLESLTEIQRILFDDDDEGEWC